MSTSHTRRELIAAALAGFFQTAGVNAAPTAAPATPEVAPTQHFPFGPVLPKRPAPMLPLRTQAGLATDAVELFAGRISAVQLMFTGCSATCPIQGALFSQAQSELGNRLADAQFVSITIDPLSDTPAALAAWLRRFDAKRGWLAAAPRVNDVDRLIAWLGQGGEQRPRGTDPHTGQVFIINRRGELAHRTVSMPPAADIVSALKGVAAQAGA